MVENEEKFWNERKTILLAFGKDPDYVDSEITIMSTIANDLSVLRLIGVTKIEYLKMVQEYIHNETEELK